MQHSSKPEGATRPAKNFLDAIDEILDDIVINDHDKMILIANVTTAYIIEHPEVEIKIG